MKVIVTGGSGFVGSNLVKKLNKNGIDRIVIIDNYCEEKLKNVRDLSFLDYIDYTNGVKSVKDYLQSLEKPDAFFHVGANADVLESDAKKMMYQNYEFSKMYCEYCVQNDVPFIYASSSAIYGNSNDFRVISDKENPHNIYAWSKWLFDKYVMAHLPSFQNRIIGYRLFNVFGMREFHKGKNACIANRFVNFIQEKGYIDLFEDKIERDYVWVEDLAEIFHQTLLNTTVKNGIYNIGGGTPIAHNEIAEMVVNNFINEGILRGDSKDYIKMIPMPEELKEKFQFYTCARDLLPLVADITTNNKEKMNNYVRNLMINQTR